MLRRCFSFTLLIVLVILAGLPCGAFEARARGEATCCKGALTCPMHQHADVPDGKCSWRSCSSHEDAAVNQESHRAVLPASPAIPEDSVITKIDTAIVSYLPPVLSPESQPPRSAC